MSFWARIFSAAACWGLTIAVLVAAVIYYFRFIPQMDSFPMILWFLGVAVVALAVLIGVLALWMRVWLGKYW